MENKNASLPEDMGISVSEVLNHAIRFAQTKNGIVLTLLSVAFSFFYVMLAGLLEDNADSEIIMRMAEEQDYGALMAFYGKSCLSFKNLLYSCVSQIWIVGIYRSVIWLVKGERDDISMDAWKFTPVQYLKLLAVTYLSSIAVVLGLSFCVIPGVFLSVRLLLVVLYVVDNPETSISEAFSASWNMTKGYFWDLFILGIVSVLVVLAGLLLCCVGMFFSMVVMYFMLSIVYVVLYRKL